MLNKALATIFLTLTVAMALPGFAQEQRIAVVDIQSAILGSNYGQEQLQALNSDPEFAELQASLRSLQADIQALDKEAQTNAAQWSEARYATYTKQRQFKNADLQLAQQKVQAEQQRVVDAINAALGERAQAALEELIEDEGVTLLLRESAVYVAGPESDLTAKLSAKLSQ